MAGHFARIYRSIWDDHDFLALTPAARLTYFAITSSKKMSACGVVDHRPARWAKATGYDTGLIADVLGELQDARFIAVDHDTAEIAVRTYVKWDSLAEQPNRGVAVWNAWETIESDHLRRWLAAAFPPELWDATRNVGKRKGQSAVPSGALAYRDQPVEPTPERRSVPPEHPLERAPEPPHERTLGRGLEPPYPYPPSLPVTSSQQPAHARPDATNEPAPPGPAAAAPATGQTARAAVLTAAVAEVARRRDTHQRAQAARNPDGWYRSALAGIEHELLEHQAHELIHAGAGPDQLADLIAPTDGPLAPVTPLRPGPAPVTTKDRSCTCGGTGWLPTDEPEDDAHDIVTRCPDCNPDPHPA